MEGARAMIAVLCEAEHGTPEHSLNGCEKWCPGKDREVSSEQSNERLLGLVLD